MWLLLSALSRSAMTEGREWNRNTGKMRNLARNVMSKFKVLDTESANEEESVLVKEFSVIKEKPGTTETCCFAPEQQEKCPEDKTSG